jgi:hypothetical protein
MSFNGISTMPFQLLVAISFCNVYLFFDLILYVTIQNFMIGNPTLSTWVVHSTYTQLDYHSTKSI